MDRYELERADLSKLPRVELLVAHIRCHQWWADLSPAHRKGPQGAALVTLHHRIRDELLRRGLNHRDVADIDRATPQRMPQAAQKVDETDEVEPEGLPPTAPMDGKPIEASAAAPSDVGRHTAEVLQHLPDRIVWIPAFASITGGAVYARGREPHDVDCILRAQEGDPWHVPVDAGLSLKLERALSAAFSLPVHFVAAPTGPNWTHYPVYDLALVRRGDVGAPVLVDEPEFAAQHYKAEPSVHPSREIVPLKPYRGAAPAQPMTLDTALDMLPSERYPVYSSTKRDGARHVLYKHGDRVRIVSDDGTDNTQRLPRLAAALARIPHDLILDAEVELWRDGQHFPREAAAGAIHAGRDEDLVVNLFDCLYLDKDLHAQPLSERLQALESLDLKPPFRVIPHRLARDRAHLRKLAQGDIDVPGSEGCVLKPADGPYDLDGTPRRAGWVKFHKNATIRAVVLSSERTKGGAYVHTYGIPLADERARDTATLHGRPYMVIGKTFARAERFAPGTPIAVECETANLERDEDRRTVQLSLWVPNLIGPAEGDPMTLDEAVSAARKAGILQEKVRSAGEVVYLPTAKGEPIAEKFYSPLSLFPLWGSKWGVAKKIIARFPPHTRYVEPFCGAAAVFFTKLRSDEEVLCDLNPDIVFVFQFLQRATDDDLHALAAKEWKGSEAQYRRVFAMKPQRDVDRAYRILYLYHFGYTGASGRVTENGFCHTREGVVARKDFARLARARDRLRGVTIRHMDALEAIRTFDGPDTLFYLDPPYPSSEGDSLYAYADLDYGALFRLLERVKGKFILSLPSGMEVPKPFRVERIKTLYTSRRVPGAPGEWVYNQLAMNFSPRAHKASPDEDAEDVMPAEHAPEQEKASSQRGLFSTIGSKWHVAEKIIARFPPHRRYVEPFCGSAAVFFTKPRSEEEVLSDLNEDTIFLFRFIQRASDEDLRALAAKDWEGKEPLYQRLHRLQPRTPLERAYRTLYLYRFSFVGGTGTAGESDFRHNDEGSVAAYTFDRLARVRERLRGVKILHQDAREVIRAYDAPDTLFYLDPPYPKGSRTPGMYRFDELDFRELYELLSRIQGKFVLSLPTSAEVPEKFRTERVRMWYGSHHLPGSGEWAYEQLAMNFPAAAQEKALSDYPDEDEDLRFVLQAHFRGRSVHLDFRAEYKRGDDHFLRGFTLAAQMPDAIREPITTMEAARKALANPDLWKVDFARGLFKPRTTRAGHVVRAELRAFPKASEIPRDWLGVEGVTERPDPDERPPTGATRHYPGVFVIVDKGRVSWGAQKPYFREFFLEGERFRGRLVFRMLGRAGEKGLPCDLCGAPATWSFGEDDSPATLVLCDAHAQQVPALKEDTLPPGAEETEARVPYFWVAMQPEDQTPYVLTDEAIRKGWLPPQGVSCLPEDLRKRVPEHLRFWETSGDKAQEARRNLAEVEELGGPALTKQEDGHFVLLRRWFRGQMVIRFGPSTEVYDLFLPNEHFVLDGDPSKGEVVALPEKFSAYTTMDGRRLRPAEVTTRAELRNRTAANPTKDTPAFVEPVDRGPCRVLERREGLTKFHLSGTLLRGAYLLHQPEGEAFWLMEESRGPRLATRQALARKGRLLDAFRHLWDLLGETVQDWFAKETSSPEPEGEGAVSHAHNLSTPDPSSSDEAAPTAFPDPSLLDPVKVARLQAPSFWTVKQADGRYRWVAISSTAVEDREREVVSREAMDRAISAAEGRGDHGILDFWHTPVRLGTCDFQAREGLCLLESGLWDDHPAVRRIAEKVASAPDRWAVSLLFLYNPERVSYEDGLKVYRDIRIPRRALLPHGKEAARFTQILVKEDPMDQHKERVLRELVGDDQLVDELLSAASEVEDKAAAENLVTKAAKPRKPEDEEEEPTEAKGAQEALDELAALVAKVTDASLKAKFTAALAALRKALASYGKPAYGYPQPGKKETPEAISDQPEPPLTQQDALAALEGVVERLERLLKALEPAQEQTKEQGEPDAPKGALYRASQDPSTAVKSTEEFAGPGSPFPQVVDEMVRHAFPGVQ